MDSIAKLMEKFGVFFKELPIQKKIMLVLGVAAAAAAVTGGAMYTGRQEFAVLFSGLEPQDSGAVVTKLKEMQIPVQLDGGGSVVMVPEERLAEARVSLAERGLPQSGVGFELFDDQKTGMTSFAQHLNFQRALQGELTRTINRISGIAGSRVHLVIPEPSPFLRNKEDPRASVYVKLKAGAALRQEQVAGIVHLVTGSVNGISAEDVTVIDDKGRVLHGGGSGMAGLSDGQVGYRQGLEAEYKQKIENALGRVLGPGRAIAQVTADLDFSLVERTEEIYDPEKTAVRSEKRSEEKRTMQKGEPGGSPGTPSNLPPGGESGSQGQNEQGSKSSESVTYEIAKKIERTTEQVGDVKKLAVAVVVDGKYETDGKGATTYSPRTDDEMVLITKVVQSAIGYDPTRGDKVEVVNMPFQTEEILEAEPAADNGGLVGQIIRAVIVLVGIALIFFTVVRPVMKTTPQYATVRHAMPAIPGQPRPAMMPMPGQELSADEVKALAAGDIDRTVLAIREWLEE